MQKFQKFNPWFSLSSGCFIEKNYEMIKEIPLDRLLLESDSPSMFNKNIYSDENEYSYYFVEESKEQTNENTAHKKYQNHPMSIIQLANKIAELRNIDVEILMGIIKSNNQILIDNI
jgi:Tat protein secretion system quality control protein TatD with DNase activity